MTPCRRLGESQAEVAPGGQNGPEAGAATVLVLAMVGLLCFVMVGLAAGVGLVKAQRVAQSAADLAALAAAQSLRAQSPADRSAAGGGSGCDRAHEIAQANGTALTSCEITGREVQVTVVVPGARWLGREVEVVAEARAGPSAAHSRA